MRAWMLLAFLLCSGSLYGQAPAFTIGNAVQLRWGPVANATGYNIYRDGVSLNGVSVVRTSAFTDLTGQAGVLYHYTIFPIVNGRESFPLPVLTVGIPAPLPPQPLPPGFADDVHVTLKKGGVLNNVRWNVRRGNTTTDVICTVNRDTRKGWDLR